MKKILSFIFLLTYVMMPASVMAGAASIYKITITKMELHNGTSWVTVFSGTSSTIDIAAANSGEAAGNFLSGLSVPDGVYSKVRTTVSTTITISGSDSSQYTTAATFTSGGNTGCVASATAANETACDAVVATTPEDTTTFSSPVTVTNGNASHKIRVNFDTSSAISYNGVAGAIFPNAPTVTVTTIALQ